MHFRLKGLLVLLLIASVPLFLYGKSASLTAKKTTLSDPKMTAEEFLMNPIVRDQIQDEALGMSDDAGYNVKCNKEKNTCELAVQDGESEFHFTFNPAKDFVFDPTHREFALYLHKKDEKKPDFIIGQYDDETSAIIDAEYRFPTEKNSVVEKSK